MWFSPFERCSALAQSAFRQTRRPDCWLDELIDPGGAICDFDRICRPGGWGKLKQNQEKLAGLIENTPKKGIDNRTIERLLKMFDNITLTIMRLPGQNIRHMPALTPVQVRILELLGLSADVYTRLAYNSV